MLIGINQNYEIKQINNITDTSLTVIEIDETLESFPFKNWSNNMILCYCYDKSSGIAVYPQSKERFDEWEKLRLQQENEMLKAQLSATQEAVNFLLMGGTK